MFTLKISTSNEAFDDEGMEIARILGEVANQVALSAGGRSDHKIGNSIRDINGNTVGKWELR